MTIGCLIFLQGIWCCCAHFQIHIQFWPLDLLENCLTELAIAITKNVISSFPRIGVQLQNVIGHQSEKKILQKNDHKYLPN